MPADFMFDDDDMHRIAHEFADHMSEKDILRALAEITVDELRTNLTTIALGYRLGARDSAATDRMLADLSEKSPELLIQSLIEAVWNGGRHVDDVAGELAADMTRAVGRAPVLCPDPETHDWLFRSSETTWRQRAAGQVRVVAGLCPYCELQLPTGGTDV